jgi:predicted permease
MATLLQDVRYAPRQLRKNPGFTTVAVLTLALGIGANTAVFSVVDAVMLRPLLYHQPEPLIEAQSINTHNPQPSAISHPDCFDWRSQNHTLEHPVSYRDNEFTLTGLERPVQVDAQVVSWDFLPALGVQPELGRGFTAGEEKGGNHLVLISHALWVSQFASDKSIVGQGIHLSGDLYTVIGVMPATFRFPVNQPKVAIWTTLAVDDDPRDPKPNTKNRESHFLNAFGRLKPGVTVAQADQDIRTIAGNLSKQYPNTNTKHDSGRVVTEVSALLGETRTVLLVVLGAVALALLIACGNIANLLLARMRERARELALRSALGAFGILTGIVFSLTVSSLMQTLLFGVRPWDAPTLAVVAAVLAISALLASYIPARRAARIDPMVALRYE